MRLQNSTSHYRQLTFGMAFSSSQKFSFQILVFDEVTKCNVSLDGHHSNESDSTSECTNLNTIMQYFEPKPLFLMMSERGESGPNVAHWCIFSIMVCFVNKLEEVVWGMVPWLIRNQEDAPFLWCVLCTEVTQTDIPGAFFQVLMNIGLMCLTWLVWLYHTRVKQGFCCSGVSAVYGGPRAHQPQLGNRLEPEPALVGMGQKRSLQPRPHQWTGAVYVTLPKVQE